MLALGSSKPWQDVMEHIAGTRKMDATPMMEYYKPLNDWLTEQNEGYDVIWSDICPHGSLGLVNIIPETGTCIKVSTNVYIFILCIFLLKLI